MSSLGLIQLLDTVGEKRLRNGLSTQIFQEFSQFQDQFTLNKPENSQSTQQGKPDIWSRSSYGTDSLFEYTENFSNQSFLASNELFSLKGGAKKRKSLKISTGSTSKPLKKRKTSESKEKSSKLAATFSPKMKKKSNSFTENSVDLTIYTSPSKTLNPSSRTPSPRKSPRSPVSRKVIFNLDQNMVLEFNKKKIISRAKITPKKKSSKGILKVRTSPRRKESTSHSN